MKMIRTTKPPASRKMEGPSEGKRRPLAHALDYSNRGLHIFPVHSIRFDGSCSCGKEDCSSPGKHPLVKWKQMATIDAGLIRKWFAKEIEHNNNIAITTGVKSGIIVLDVDSEEGEEFLVELEKEHGKLPVTVIAQTGGGGRHIYFSHPGGHVNNRINVANKGIDVKADGGYVVAPPSIHKSGEKYTWLKSPFEADFASCPGWLLRLIQQPAAKDQLVRDSKRSFDPLKLLAGVPEGQRDDALFEYARDLKRRGSSREEAYILAEHVAKLCAPPFPEEETRKKVDSAWTYPYGRPTDELGHGFTVEQLQEAAKSCMTHADQFIKEKIPKPRVVLSPWLTTGSLSMIYGERGIGKTWLALIIAVALTRENYDDIDIFTWWVNKAADVYFLDGEMEEHFLQKRLKKLIEPLGEECRPLTLLSAHSMARKGLGPINISNPIWREMLYNTLAEQKEYKVLVLDNLSSLAPGLDENTKKDWDPINQWLISLRHLGVAVIFIHHSGKSGRQRGTSGREDVLDCTIKLTRPKNFDLSEGTAYFNVEFEKARNIEPGADLSPFSLKLAEVDEKRNLKWETHEKASKANEKETEIKVRLLDEERNKDIAKAVGCSPSYVSQVKKSLDDNGLIDNSGKPTDKGLKWRKKTDLSNEKNQ